MLLFGALSSILAIFSLFLAVCYADQPLSVNSINLAGWQGCSSADQTIISRSWEDAVTLAESLTSPNFNEAAALEYLGPPGYNKAYQQSISDIFTRLSTFGQGSKGEPSFFKWTIYVRCDDWLNICTKLRSAGAYTENRVGGPNGPKATFGARLDSTTVINYCPLFFDLPNLNDKIGQNQNEEANIKLNLDWYRGNTGMSSFISFFQFEHSFITRNLGTFGFKLLLVKHFHLASPAT